MNGLQLLRTALVGAIALGSTAAAETPPPVEKCFGVAKAGKNDCQTATTSCAGSARQDRQPDAWIYVPNGTVGSLNGDGGR